MLGRSLTLMEFVSAEMRGTKVKLALGLDECAGMAGDKKWVPGVG